MWQVTKILARVLMMQQRVGGFLTAADGARCGYRQLLVGVGSTDSCGQDRRQLIHRAPPFPSTSNVLCILPNFSSFTSLHLTVYHSNLQFQSWITFKTCKVVLKLARFCVCSFIFARIEELRQSEGGQLGVLSGLTGVLLGSRHCVG